MRCRLRPSGVLVGAMVETLGLRDLGEPNAPPWLLGEPIGVGERRVVVAAIARELVVAGLRLVPSIGAFELDEAEALGDAILHGCDAWEALREVLDREVLPLRADDEAWLSFAFLRLSAIDLVMRGAAAGVLARAHDEAGAWSPSRGFDALIAGACAALEQSGRPADERRELGEQLEAGLWRLLERGEQELVAPSAPGRAGLLELVRRGTRASAGPWLAERLRRAEADPLWAADLRAACEPWIERLRECVRRLAGKLDSELVPPTGQAEPDPSPAACEELHAESRWIVQSDHVRDASAPERRAGRDRSFVLPVDEHPPEWERSLQLGFLDAEDELDGALEHGRRALQLAPDDPGLLASVGTLLAERACERRHPGWEYHVDVGMALLRRATRIEPSWDRPWIEIGIVLADVGAWARARAWVEGIPSEVPVTARRLRLRAALLGSHGQARA